MASNHFQASTWPVKLDFYRNHVRNYDEQFKPMLNLVEQIVASPYAAGLHPITSHNTLLLSQTKLWKFKHEILEIEYSTSKKQFTFTFWEHPTTRPWITYCKSDEAFQRFEKCLATKGWFAFS